MDLKFLLLSTSGTLDRGTFWKSILILNFLSLILAEIGNTIFFSIGPDKISFLMFFLTKMLPRFVGIFVLIFSFFIAKKRVNEMGSHEWLPIAYVFSLFLPSFLLAFNLESLYMFSIIVPVVLTFILGLIPPIISK